MPSMTMSAQEARDLLDLQPGYEKAELSSAYRRVVRSVHPDLLVGSSEEEVRDASDRLAQVNMANELLQRALRINATEFTSPPEPSPFAAPSSTTAPFASAPTSFAPPAAPETARSTTPRSRRSIALAVVIAVLAVTAFIAVVQLL